MIDGLDLVVVSVVVVVVVVGAGVVDVVLTVE